MNSILKDNNSRVGLLLCAVVLNLFVTFVSVIRGFVIGGAGSSIITLIILLVLAAGIFLVSANPSLCKLLSAAAFFLLGIMTLVSLIRSLPGIFHGYAPFVSILITLCLIPEGLGYAACAAGSFLDESFDQLLKFGALAVAVFIVIPVILGVLNVIFNAGFRYIFSFGYLLSLANAFVRVVLFGLIFLFASDIM